MHHSFPPCRGDKLQNNLPKKQSEGIDFDRVLGQCQEWLGLITQISDVDMRKIVKIGQQKFGRLINEIQKQKALDNKQKQMLNRPRRETMPPRLSQSKYQKHQSNLIFKPPLFRSILINDKPLSEKSLPITNKRQKIKKQKNLVDATISLITQSNLGNKLLTWLRENKYICHPKRKENGYQLMEVQRLNESLLYNDEHQHLTVDHKKDD